MNHLGNIRHGQHGTLTYKRWKSMKQRCASKPHYTANGITVCERWSASFSAFLEDMGECPSEDMTLDRIDNAAGYRPGNCRWASRTEQSRNRSMNRPITHDGRTMLVSEWAAQVGAPANTIRQRLYLGWTEQRALTTPVQQRGKQR